MAVPSYMFLWLIGVAIASLLWTRQDTRYFRDAALKMLLTKAELKWLRARGTGDVVSWQNLHSMELMKQDHERLKVVIEELGYIHRVDAIVQKRSAEHVQMQRLKVIADDARWELDNVKRAKRDEIYDLECRHMKTVDTLTAEITQAKIGIRKLEQIGCSKDEALAQKDREISDLSNDIFRVKRTMGQEIESKLAYISEIQGNLVQKDELLGALKTRLEWAQADLAKKDNSIQELTECLKAAQADLVKREAFIQKLRSESAQKFKKCLESKKADLAKKDEVIQELKKSLESTKAAMVKNDESAQKLEDLEKLLIRKDTIIQNLHTDKEQEQLIECANNVAKCFQDCITLTYIEDPILLHCGHVINTPPDTKQARDCMYIHDFDGRMYIKCPMRCGPQGFHKPTGLKTYFKMCAGHVKDLLFEVGSD